MRSCRSSRAESGPGSIDALRLLRRLRDHPRDAGPWGEPAFAREVERIRRDLAPIVSRRALAASFGREAFRRAARTGPTGRGVPDRSPTRSAGSSSATADAATGVDKSRRRARLTRPRSRARYPSRMRLSSLFFTTLRDDPPTPRCRRIACSSGPATSASSAPASTRCCRSASGSTSGSSRSSARRWTGSAARRWRCRWSTRPTSGRRAGATTRSARSWPASRTATGATWSWR